MGTRRRASAGVVCVLAASIAAAPAPPAIAQSAPADFTGLTMEQLMEVELVRSASRHPQSLREAPSAVTVVTAEEIRRQGYRTLADVLAALPSFYVTYDRNYSYVGVRGFGRPGDYSTRVLVLVNGARANDNVYEGVYVGSEFLLDMDLVERVEVVRGPAASLYGNSALFAVVNVVTRRGAQMQGGEVSAGAGAFGTFNARAAYGRRTKGGLDFMLAASVLDSAGQDLFYPEYAGATDTGGWARGRDGEAARKSFASAEWRGFTLHAAQVWRRKDVPTGAYGTIFGDPDSRTWDAMRQFALQYEREVGRASLSGRVQHQQYDYRGHYPYGPDGLWADSANGRWWRGEAGASIPLRHRHVLTFGLEGQLDTRQDQDAGYAGSSAELDVRDSGTRWGAYVQEELRLGPLTAHVGMRHDSFEAYGHTSPRLALVHQSGAGTIKLLFGTAFRAPNEYERHYYGENDSLRPETIRTLEAIVERSFGADTRVTLSAFENRISRLITVTGEASELSFFNAGAIHSHGIEAAGEWRRPQGLRGRASYSWQTTHEAATGTELTNSPRHAAKLGLDIPLASRHAWAGLALRYQSRRLTLAGSQVPASTLADLTLSAPRLFKGAGVLVSVRDVFDAQHADPGSEEHRQDAIAQDGRAFHIQMSWAF